jgi:DNA-binding NarL/FixJ family response regulator
MPVYFYVNKQPIMRINKKKLNFSTREMEVLWYVKEGYTTREIADALTLAEDTVEGHRRSMIKKSGARNMIVVVYAAKSYGLI